jgi:iron uptake system component EfeO
MSQRPEPGRAAPASPTGSAHTDPRLVPAVRSYEAYLRGQAAALPARARPFTDAVRAGDVTAAKKRFAASRTSWERIQSIGILLPQLDRRIDARADDFATPTDPAWTGWHRLERILWTEDSSTDAAALATQLDRDLELLRKAVLTLPITPETMAAGIERLVEETIAEKLPGAEDRYSRVDLADLAANVQGAEAGYSTARPVLTTRDAALTRLLDRQFAAVDHTIAKYRTPAGYRPYPALSAADRTLLQSQLSALAETLSGLSGVFER